MPRTLRLYNTASRSIETFEPSGRDVRMYCCGPTVYHVAHIGNLRTYVFVDTARRLLKSVGYGVRHVMNITNVGHLTSDADTGEDRMEKGAKREGRTVWDIARLYTDKFMDNIRALNIEQPEIVCRATDHIPEMIDLVRRLEEKGFTYRTSDGIYFDTSKFPSYGDFARLEPESIRAGARVEMGDKRNPTDFALWKLSPSGARRQMEWESPWGTGFPGWHIECSAMSLKYLEQPLDIHCGGADLVRVHHTNEIAQVEAATGRQYCRFWLHGEFLVIDKVKMAKSGDNFVTLDTAVEKGIDPLAYRLFCYSAHYRSPLTFSWEGVEASANALTNLRKTIAEVKGLAGTGPFDPATVDTVLTPFWDAACDDMNMPRAVAALWEFVKSESVSAANRIEAVRIADTVLGLDLLSYRAPDVHAYSVNTRTGVVRINGSRPLDPAVVQMLADKVAARKTARKEKNFALADQIRNELTLQGIDFKDLPDGSTECFVK